MKMIWISRREFVRKFRQMQVVSEEFIIRFERTRDKGLASVIQDMDPFQKN